MEAIGIDLVFLHISGYCFRTLCLRGQISYTIMAALLSSWWSGKGSEGEKEEGESKTESWSAGIGSEKLLGRQ